MSDKKTALIIAGVIGAIGFSIIVCQLGWLPGLGLALAMWGNNVQRSAMRGEIGDDYKDPTP